MADIIFARWADVDNSNIIVGVLDGEISRTVTVPNDPQNRYYQKLQKLQIPIQPFAYPPAADLAAKKRAGVRDIGERKAFRILALTATSFDDLTPLRNAAISKMQAINALEAADDAEGLFNYDVRADWP